MMSNDVRSTALALASGSHLFMAKLTLKTFRELTANLPEDTPIYYHAYDNGCCLGGYVSEDLWLFPKGDAAIRGVVINPGEDYDPRRPATANGGDEGRPASAKP